MTAHREPRRFGGEGPPLSMMGLGTWAIGGPFFSGEGCHYPTGAPLGYGDVDDRQSTRAIHAAVDLGISLFDTSDVYGTGHSERVLGAALAGKRDDVLIATKFGNTYDDATKELTGTDISPTYIRHACEASLQRLGTDRIDLYQLHLGDLAPDDAVGVADTLERLSQDGLIRAYGWSTDDPERARSFAGRPHAAAAQFDMNVFEDAQAMVETCRGSGFVALARVPLAMGFLSGKFTVGSKLPANDIRSNPPTWLRYFDDGGHASAAWIAKLDAIKEILTSGGRTAAQGALAWIWGRDQTIVPIPGARTEAQVTENAGAMALGPLTPAQMAEIDTILER
ncbi:MAG: aldo/keto reductase [Pseudomonadota bacterium]